MIVIYFIVCNGLQCINPYINSSLLWPPRCYETAVSCLTFNLQGLWDGGSFHYVPNTMGVKPLHHSIRQCCFMESEQSKQSRFPMPVAPKLWNLGIVEVHFGVHNDRGPKMSQEEQTQEGIL